MKEIFYYYIQLDDHFFVNSVRMFPFHFIHKLVLEPCADRRLLLIGRAVNGYPCTRLTD